MTDDYASFMQEQTPRLLRLAWVLTGNRQDAEDLTQETLLRLHRRSKRVSAAENMTAYANRVMVNCHLDRHKERRPEIVSLIDSDAPADDSTANVDNRLALHDALAKLPNRQRTIVVLRYYEQLSTKEIGNLMSIEESSVRSDLARALTALESTVADHPTA